MNLVEYARIHGEYTSTIRNYLCEEMPGGRLMWDKYEYKLKDKYFGMATFSEIDTWIQERRKEEKKKMN